MWKDKLEKIKTEFENDYGFIFNNPASYNEISRLEVNFLEKFKVKLSD